MRNGFHSYENEFRLQVHFHGNQTHLHTKGFSRGLGLKLRHKVNGEMAALSAVSKGFVISHETNKFPDWRTFQGVVVQNSLTPLGNNNLNIRLTLD